MSRVSPCVVWATEADIPDNCDVTAVPPATLTEALNFSTDVLYNLTRRRWPGLCSDLFRPIGANCCYSTGCYDNEGERLAHDGIRLPASDVRAITQVKVDGSVIAASRYHLRDGRYLYATTQADGSVLDWPCWNDLHQDAADAIDTFSIAYTHGADPPASMVLAAALLGWELALAWTPSCAGECRLPKRVTTIVRAGVTFAVIDPLTVFEKGQVGIPDIDMLIAAVNRGENTQRAFVGRPGSPSRVSRP